MSVIPCLLAAAGCSDNKPAASSAWLDFKSPQQLLDIALEDPLPDARRKAVQKLAAGSSVNEPWAVTAFDSIARTDPDSMVRVAAVRGLARGNSPTVPTTMVKLLSSRDARQEDTVPAPASVRWEAARALSESAAGAGMAEADRESALTCLLERAEKDPDRNVRIACLTGLGCFRDRRVPPLLVAALRSRDYALQRRAEQSLRALTGQSFDLDAQAWSEWLAATPDPFAAAAPLADSTRRGWWAETFGGG